MSLSKDTNVQKNLNKQIQHLSLKSKISVGETVDLCYRWCTVLGNNRLYVDSGKAVNYGPKKNINRIKQKSAKTVSSGSSKKNLNKNYHNDGRAPDTTKALIGSPVTVTNSSIGNVIGIKWSFMKPNGQVVTNTCAADTILTIVRSIEKDMNTRGLSIFHGGANTTHVLKRSFDFIDDGDDAMARYILTDKLFPNGYKTSRETNNWFGDLNDYENNMFKGVLGVEFVIRKRCLACGAFNGRRKNNTTVSCIPFYRHSTDPKQMFSDFNDDLKFHHVGQIPVKHCIAHTAGCKGPSINVTKRIVQIRGNILIFNLPSMPDVHLKDIPVMPMFDDKRFTLRAAVGGSSIHFVGYIQDGDGWIFYNGMDNPTLQKKSIDSPFLESKLKRYPICSIFYEVCTDIPPTSKRTPLPSRSVLDQMPSDSDTDGEILPASDDDHSLSSFSLKMRTEILKNLSTPAKKQKSELASTSTKKHKSCVSDKSKTRKRQSPSSTIKNLKFDIPSSKQKQSSEYDAVVTNDRKFASTPISVANKSVVIDLSSPDTDSGQAKKAAAKLNRELAKLQDGIAFKTKGKGRHYKKRKLN